MKRWWMLAAGALIGGLGGWLYWSNVGCTSGGCPITSDPVISTLYGSVLGGLLASGTGRNKDTTNVSAEDGPDDRKSGSSQR